jgi:exopolyphosphatase/guanosine-5'-triphosphate,3'-diphosphate pyrophosphatase
MKKAIIDLGTNTFNLLIAELKGKDFSVLHAEKEGVAIGMGGINSNKITEESMIRGEIAIRRFLDVCKEYRVEKINAFGTSALRDASNTADFLKRLNDKFQLKVAVISGDKEAELIYRGVHQLYDFEEKGVIIDIGGGSTEIIFADKKGVNAVASLNIGVSRIYQKFETSDPLIESDVQVIRNFLEDNSHGFLDNRNEPIMIGSSGSFETFWELGHLEEFPNEPRIVEIEKDIFEATLHETIRSTMKEREVNPFILPIRKIMAPITAVKTLWLMEKLKTEKVLISPYSLKEGALFTDDFKVGVEFINS